MANNKQLQVQEKISQVKTKLQEWIDNRQQQMNCINFLEKSLETTDAELIDKLLCGYLVEAKINIEFILTNPILLRIKNGTPTTPESDPIARAQSLRKLMTKK